MVVDSKTLDQQTKEEIEAGEPSDWEEIDAFFEEWLEEKQAFMQGMIKTRPLHSLMVRFFFLRLR